MPNRDKDRSPSPERKGKPPEKKSGVPQRNEKPLTVPKLGASGKEVTKPLRTKQDMFLAAITGVANQSRPAGQKITGAKGEAALKGELRYIAKQHQKVNDKNAQDVLAAKARMRTEFAENLAATKPGDIKVAFSTWKHVTSGNAFDQETHDACLALNIQVDDEQNRVEALRIWVQNQRPEDFTVTEGEKAKLNFSIALPPDDPRKKSTTHVAGFMRRDNGTFMITHLGPGAVF